MASVKFGQKFGRSRIWRNLGKMAEFRTCQSQNSVQPYSTYPENLVSGGQLPAELRGRVCLFCFFVRFFVCPSRYVARHRKPRRCIYVLNLGGTGIRPPDSFSYHSIFRFRSSFRFRSRSSSCSTTSGDIFYCRGSRQLNQSGLDKMQLCL